MAATLGQNYVLCPNPATGFGNANNTWSADIYTVVSLGPPFTLVNARTGTQITSDDPSTSIAWGFLDGTSPASPRFAFGEVTQIISNNGLPITATGLDFIVQEVSHLVIPGVGTLVFWLGYLIYPALPVASQPAADIGFGLLAVSDQNLRALGA